MLILLMIGCFTSAEYDRSFSIDSVVDTWWEVDPKLVSKFGSDSSLCVWFDSERQELDFLNSIGDWNLYTYRWEILADDEIKVEDWGRAIFIKQMDGLLVEAHPIFLPAKKEFNLTNCYWKEDVFEY